MASHQVARIDAALKRAAAEVSGMSKTAEAARLTLIEDNSREVLASWLLRIEKEDIKIEASSSLPHRAEAKCTLRVFEAIATKELTLARAALTGQLRVSGRNVFKQWQTFLRLAMNFLNEDKQEDTIKEVSPLRPFCLRCGKQAWLTKTNDLDQFYRSLLKHFGMSTAAAVQLGLPTSPLDTRFHISIRASWKRGRFHFKAQCHRKKDETSNSSSRKGRPFLVMNTFLLLPADASRETRHALLSDILSPLFAAIYRHEKTRRK